MDGFAFTGEALCGRNFGAGDRNGLNTTVRYLLWWSAGIALVFTLLYSSGWQWVTCLLTDDMVVRESVSQNHIWIQCRDQEIMGSPAPEDTYPISMDQRTHQKRVHMNV